MVKNFGGNKAKGFARKHANSSKGATKLRVVEFDGEIYAIATAMLGNCMFHAAGIDGNTYLVQIRGKFTGRFKRDNIVTVGSWVLIGAREFTAASDIKKAKIDEIIKADLLEVYTEDDKKKLMNTVTADWHILNNNDLTRQQVGMKADVDDGIIFASSQEVDDLEILEMMKTKKMETISLQVDSSIDNGTSHDWIDASDI
jgi:hypothetical protein